MELFKFHKTGPELSDLSFDAPARPKHFRRSQLRAYSPEEILTLVQLNEVTNIEIASNRKTARIGASSTRDQLSGGYGQKLYYVEDQQYSDLNRFRKALDPYIKDGAVSVLSVDGVLAEKLK